MVTQDRLKELFTYDPDTGLFIRRLTKRQWKEGSIAGTRMLLGYICIGIDGQRYLAHRLAWLYIHGYMPEGLIDHKNGMVDDNRIDNLRQADKSRNAMNAKRPSDNTSGHKGIDFHKGTGKWRARLHVGKKEFHLGLFAELSDAVQAIGKKRLELHGEFSNNG